MRHGIALLVLLLLLLLLLTVVFGVRFAHRREPPINAHSGLQHSNAYVLGSILDVIEINLAREKRETDAAYAHTQVKASSIRQAS